MNLTWLDDFSIALRLEGGDVLLSANREGLLSLSAQLAALAQEPPGSHIHYDTYNALEEGSLPLIVERLERGED